MATNQEIIDLALAKIDVIEAGETANATDSATALGVLNRMMAEWRERSMDLNWFTQDTLGDDAPVPEWAEEAVIANLAVRAASDFTAMVTPGVMGEAMTGRRTIGNTLISQTLDNADMSHMPYGSGRQSRYNIETDS
jgi:hypothetical protein